MARGQGSLPWDRLGRRSMDTGAGGHRRSLDEAPRATTSSNMCDTRSGQGILPWDRLGRLLCQA
eukprot:4488930-Pyramimonas_sp.AAC.2